MKIVLAAAFVAMGLVSAQAQTAGDWVLAKWKNGAYWFPGIIQSIQGDKLVITYDDGDKETLYASSVRPYDWKVGSKVECDFKGAGKWYSGKISALNGASVSIAYDDGDRENTKTGRCRSN